jgi:L-aminopeptidase/D-esterase-like protein
VLDDGSTVAALVVVNAVGSVFDPATGELWGARHLLPGEVAVGQPDVPAAQAFAEQLAAQRAAAAGAATTLVVVATDRTLTKAQCAKVAGVSHDGLARAISPVHTMFDGDTSFALATGERPAPDPFALHALLTAAADCTTRAVVRAVLAAERTTTPAGTWPAYRDLLRR